MIFNELKSNSLIISYLEINNYAIHPPLKRVGFLAKGLRLDRGKTLGEMKKLYEGLDLNMPDNCASFIIVNGKTMQQNFGMVDFLQLKAKDKTKIEKAKADLVEKLKEVEGPCLSFDAPGLYEQFARLYVDAPKLIEEYGDVLKNPMWRARLFKLDP